MLRAAALAALLVCAIAAPAGALVLPPAGATPGWRFVTVDHPAAATATYLTSLRADGTAVGAHDSADGTYHGFVRRPDGSVTAVDVPGARSTYALGINRQGAIAGTYVDAGGLQHGFVRSPGGAIRTIDVPGASAASGAASEFGTGLGTAAGTITDGGSVVGTWGDAAGAAHGYILRPDGRRTDYDAPGAQTAKDPLTGNQGGTNVIRRNRRGQYVGSYAPAAGRRVAPVDLRAFVRTAGRWTTLLPEGTLTSQAFAITDAGTVGGVAFAPGGVIGFAFLWRDGRYTRLDPKAGALFSTVADITAAGVVTGEYLTADGRTHGYIGYPPGA